MSLRSRIITICQTIVARLSPEVANHAFTITAEGQDWPADEYALIFYGTLITGIQFRVNGETRRSAFSGPFMVHNRRQNLVFGGGRQELEGYR